MLCSLPCLCRSASTGLISPFRERLDHFASCQPNKSHPSVRLKCFDEGFCYLGCPKCGSTSMSSQFHGGRATHVEGCDFSQLRGRSIVVLYRQPTDHFMSAYAQITYQGLKRADKVKQARRNMYGRVDIFKDPRTRLRLFIEAVADEERRDMIPDVGHVFQMMHFFKGLHSCLRSPSSSKSIGVPPIYFVNLANASSELDVVFKTINIPHSSFVHSSKHAAVKPSKHELRSKSKLAAQYVARHTTLDEELLGRIEYLTKADGNCFI